MTIGGAPAVAAPPRITPTTLPVVDFTASSCTVTVTLCLPLASGAPTALVTTTTGRPASAPSRGARRGSGDSDLPVGGSS